MRLLGSVIMGSLMEGFLVRLDSQISLDVIKTGKFVSIISSENRFFSMITDLKLEVTNSDILLFPPSKDEFFLQNVLKKKDIYATAQVKPMVVLDKFNNVRPVKTIPGHFAEVFEVAQEEVSLIFGDEKKDKKYFNIGNPLDMQTGVCIDLDKLVERSNAIFGKTGTGKTFISRLILAGLISNEKAVNLIFDMHSEYGLQARKEGSNFFVKGLKTLFADKVAIFSLDPVSTRRRGSMPDVEVVIPYQAINVEDILSLQDELNLNSTALESAYLIKAKYKKEWLSVLLERGQDAKEFAQEIGAHAESIAALYRKLKRVERLPFFTKEYKHFSVVDQIIEYLDRGINVIIEFGNYNSTFVYLLIANILTGRIHKKYIEKTEKFLGSQNKSDEPRKLLITIEEAHKFLNPVAAKQTIFGTIAREMRKYYVSLLLVDQRPSGIEPEILSQVGTKIIAQLSDEKDIQSVLTGVANSHILRGVLSTLDSKKQVLVLGHAITMPVVLETREYGDKFYQDISSISVQNIKEVINEIF
jgi:uncharacterized protein